MISLLLVDDHPVVRDGLRGMYTADPRFEVIGEASNGTEAIAKAASLRPDVIIMDLRMPRSDGVSAIRALAERGIPSRILVLTTYDTDRDVVAAIEAGATGYLLQDSLLERSCSERRRLPHKARRRCLRRSPPGSSGGCAAHRPASSRRGKWRCSS
jgi:DNA-binding NarL/FixJ family response regulator